MKTQDIGTLNPGSEEAKQLARQAMGLVPAPVPPKIEDWRQEMDEQLAEQDKAFNGMLQGLRMLRGACRKHQAARDAAGLIAAAAGVSNPVTSTMNGAPMPYRELDYVVFMCDLAVRKLKAGAQLSREGLSSV